MGRIKAAIQFTTFIKIVSRPWESVDKVKRAFSRGVLRLENVYRRVSRICSKALAYPAAIRIHQRRATTSPTLSLAPKSHSFSPKNISIFGADPNTVVEVIKTCEALGDMAYDLEEPEFYIREKNSNIIELRAFLASLCSESKEPEKKHYVLFLTVQEALEQEALQTRILLKKNMRALKEQLKTMEPTSKRYTLSQSLPWIEDKLLEKIDKIPLHELVKSTEYHDYQKIRYDARQLMQERRSS